VLGAAASRPGGAREFDCAAEVPWRVLQKKHPGAAAGLHLARCTLELDHCGLEVQTMARIEPGMTQSYASRRLHGCELLLNPCNHRCVFSLYQGYALRL